MSHESHKDQHTNPRRSPEEKKAQRAAAAQRRRAKMAAEQVWVNAYSAATEIAARAGGLSYGELYVGTSGGTRTDTLTAELGSTRGSEAFLSASIRRLERMADREWYARGRAERRGAAAGQTGRSSYDAPGFAIGNRCGE